MTDIIVLGIKDIFKNKVMFLLLQMSILIVAVIFVMSSKSIVYDLQQKQAQSASADQYELVPISTDMSGNKALVNRLIKYMPETAMVQFYSNSLSDQTNMDVNVVAGNGKRFSPSLPIFTNHPRVYIMNNKTSQKEIQLHGNTYPLMNLDNKQISIPVQKDTVMIIVYINKNQMGQWVDYDDGSEIMNMLLSDRDSLSMNIISKVVKESFLTVVAAPADNKEITFIMSYIYPFVILCVLLIALAFLIFNRYLLKKMRKEYTIHRLYGASITAVVMRCSVVMICAGVVDFLLFSWFFVHEMDKTVMFGYLFIVVLLSIFEVGLLQQIRNSYVMKNVRGE